MKKFLKFLFGTFTLAASILGVYYLVKNVFNKDEADEDFDDLDDDFDEFESEKEGSATDSREYVPINLNSSDDEANEETDEASEAEDSSESETTESETTEE